MKKLLLPLLLVLAVSSKAQLNNSWIDYSKTYYKFNIGSSGLYRITQPVLSSIGLGNVPAEQFQLWRNGVQVRLFTSVSTGVLGGSGFIEFLGNKNDGTTDRDLYRDPTYQLSDSFSMHTDTAAYFITVNPDAANLRYISSANNIAGNTLPADPYFMRTVAHSYKDKYNRGYAAVVGEYVYSSSYDLGEGLTSYDVNPGQDLTKEFTGLNVYTAGPANSVSFSIAAFGNALNKRNLRVKLFNTTIIDSAMDYFTIRKIRLNNLSLGLLQNADYIPVYMNGINATTSSDRIVVGQLSLTYPARFNFNNAKNFAFELRAAPQGNYLVIDNFNTSGVAPVLYSLNDGRRYNGDISVAGKVRFVLPATSDTLRKFILVSQDNSNISAITTAAPKTFLNFSVAANQGDYLIISNNVLNNDGNGNNYVEQYRQYRASAPGRSFNAKTISIEELNDQFAFGIKKHPAAIRDFIRFAVQRFTVRPKYVFLMGRGMSALEYRENVADPASEKIDLVQTFGWPASDNLLACEPGQTVPLLPIGRLSVVNGTEIKYYLDKVKEYELTQASGSNTIIDKSWMKNVVHVIGGADAQEDNLFTSYLGATEQIIEDTLFGGNVFTFRKSTSNAVQQANGEQLSQLINNGVGLIQYFGHSSANTLAFNLSSPESYSNAGKYFFFNVSGCSAGNNFIYDPARLVGNRSISENFVLADRRGSIAFLASTHLGIPPFLHFYNVELYNSISKTMYGNTIGNQLHNVLQKLGGNPQSLDYYTRINLEEVNLHGDPAVKVYYSDKPDYVIEDQLIKIEPSIISVADNNFSVKVKMMNIGKAVDDSMRITIKRKLPNDSIRVLYDQVTRAILNTDSVDFVIPINPTTDKGLNQLIVTLDVDGRISETSESNNTITKDFFIFEDEIRPVSPYNYSIVNQQNISFYASTANPLSGQRQYQMEVDTTELFNSPFKKQYTANGVGGLIQFSPTNINFTDSTVYYWRTSIVPVGGGQQIWNSFSFVYLPNGGTGFNQSHYYQHQKSAYSSTINLNANRVFEFKSVPRELVIQTGLYPYTPYDKILVTLGFDQLELYGCKYGSLQIMVYDSATMQPWQNHNVNNPSGPGGVNGLYKSWPVCTTPTRNFFEFPYADNADPALARLYRKRAMDFLDSIPSGMFVSITNLGWTAIPSSIAAWQADQAQLGTGNSLYHKLKGLGFTSLDSFTHNLPFVFFYKKGHPEYVPHQTMGTSEQDPITEIISVSTKYKSGTITSPAFGPARNWKDLHWRGTSLDAIATADTAKIEVYGVRSNGTEDLMATVAPATDTSLAFINAATYPYVKLRMQNTDEDFATPKQLNFWRINADLLPEGAVAPNVSFQMKDTVNQGEIIDFALAFKNISQPSFDSLALQFVITDKDNGRHVVPFNKLKPLVSGDTVVVHYSIDTRNYPGKNTLYIMFNPDLNQPEQYLFNNFIYKDFYVTEDNLNPLLDVTFDGVHILNRDIVAAKPHILVKLQDESHFLALKDTALLTVQVRFPPTDNTPYGELRTFYFGDLMQFIPADLTTGQNTASIDLQPYFTLDGEYELIISGKDVIGNKAGNLQYRSVFSVINKPMISNMLNYPNPFTTSTAFVFTVTGSEPPQNIRIQILTITGKIVREITKDELGPIHIGRNITEFKWDGTDSYGSKLANGVYLYRVITNLNGKSLDKYRAATDDTDQYFNKGYGKMYLMR